MKDNKKYIILIIVFVVLVIIFILAKVFKKDNFNERLITFITSKNYVKDTGSMYTYKDEEYPYNLCLKSQIDCLGKQYYFDTNTYELVFDEILKSEEVEFSFTPTYDYKTSKITYYYRVHYQNGSVVLKGDYNKDNYTCEVEYSYGIDIDDKSVYCDHLKDKLQDFSRYSRIFIDDTTLLNRMQKQK